MRRILPYPLLAAFLFAAWLALADHVTYGQVILAAVVAVGTTWAMSALRLERPVPRKPAAALKFAVLAIGDIMRSNIGVIRIITLQRRKRTSDFLIIPLELRNPTALAVLACIVTATPGTIWVNYDRLSGRLLLHILDLVDEQAWFDLIKGRYERLLMEIFE